jgi:hypothetical protein
MGGQNQIDYDGLAAIAGTKPSAKTENKTVDKIDYDKLAAIARGEGRPATPRREPGTGWEPGGVTEEYALEHPEEIMGTKRMSGVKLSPQESVIGATREMPVLGRMPGIEDVLGAAATVATPLIMGAAPTLAPYSAEVQDLAATYGPKLIEKTVESPAGVLFKQYGVPALKWLAKIGSGAILGREVMKSLSSRQAGGPVKAGQPYLVGEAGPELMMPGQAGTILPNSALGRIEAPQQAAAQIPAPQDITPQMVKDLSNLSPDKSSINVPGGKKGGEPEDRIRIDSDQLKDILKNHAPEWNRIIKAIGIPDPHSGDILYRQNDPTTPFTLREAADYAEEHPDTVWFIGSLSIAPTLTTTASNIKPSKKERAQLEKEAEELGKTDSSIIPYYSFFKYKPYTTALSISATAPSKAPQMAKLAPSAVGEPPTLTEAPELALGPSAPQIQPIGGLPAPTMPLEAPVPLQAPEAPRKPLETEQLAPPQPAALPVPMPEPLQAPSAPELPGPQPLWGPGMLPPFQPTSPEEELDRKKKRLALALMKS